MINEANPTRLAPNHHLVEHSQGLVCVHDLDGVLLAVSPATARLLGYAESDLVGRNLRDLLAPAVRPLFGDYLDRIRQASEDSGLLIVMTRDGEERVLSYRNACREEPGRPPYVLGRAQDITERRRAEVALADSERRFRALVTHAPVGIFETDAQGDCRFVNDRWTLLAGMSAEAALGDGWARALHPEDRERVFTEWYAAAQAGREFTLEYRFQRPDGTEVWVAGSAVAMRDGDGDGAVSGYFGTVTDITARRQAEAALADERDLLQVLMDNIPDTIYFKDAASRFTRINRAQARVLGVDDPAEAIGKTDFDFQGNLARTFYLEERQLLYDRRALIDRIEYNPTPDGQPRWFSATKVPVLDPHGAPLGLVGISRDVTERKRTEAALAAARDEALSASRLKSEFLATMSHEIRTPMNGIIGMTELLCETPLDGEQREFANVVRDSAQALLTIINDILDFSKIEAGKLLLDNQDFELIPLLEGSADLLAEQARDKHLALMAFVAPDLPTRLCGDSGRLRQVLLNLIGNAVKFTERGEVAVRAELAHATYADITVRFTIQDTGIGLSEAAQQRLFQPFAQADGSVTRKYGGTGLGLAISKHLVELMGGAIGVASADGQGSTFSFTARFARATDAAASEPPPLPPALRVLVVDDSATSQEFLQRYLQAWGMVTDRAGSGGDALGMLRRAAEAGRAYDLLLTDLAMSEMDGFALARAIQRDPALTRTRLILLTAFDERGQGAQALQSGFVAHLTKPIKQSQLFDALVSTLGERVVPAPDRLLHPDAAPALPLQPDQRILLVDDHAVNQQLALRQLAKLGYAADIAANGREAVEAVAAGPPYALILMDCQMPEMDGFAASRAIRDRERAGGGRTPIVAMTANAMQADRDACLQAGMDDYLSKPVRQAELQRVLARWLPVTPEPSTDGDRPVEEAAPLDRAILASLRELQSADQPDVLGELIDVFLTDARDQIEALRAAIACGDAAAIERAAHRLRGSSANLGATTLAAHCAELEALGRRPAIEGACELLHLVEIELARATQAFDAERQAQTVVELGTPGN
jgi:PAS domain S-box-containing protein